MLCGWETESSFDIILDTDSSTPNDQTEGNEHLSHTYAQEHTFNSPS